ncbi:MAG: nuclear transport factor 2 family protein, partial [Deltaproteobacteria bacterium]|nr:nuclear transport factor 2 family protein [Deltaproteobacteria bacterium]
MAEKASDRELVEQTVQLYFDGLYHGDTAKLKKAFHPQAFVIGEHQGQSLFLSLPEFLGAVEEAPKPSESGEEYDMKIVSLD